MNSSRQSVESALRTQGVSTAKELATTSGVSQATISRVISSMGHQRIARLGKGRSARYGMRHSFEAIGSDWPLYWIDQNGTPELAGRLYSLQKQQWYLEQNTPWDTLRGEEFPDGLYPGLPWFLNDLRPQGFLGRCFARRYASELGAPSDPRRWSDENVIRALVRLGFDLSGAFVIGEEMMAEVQNRTNTLAVILSSESRNNSYPEQANAVLNDEIPGSSAAGEQPKFTACLREPGNAVRHVIVKFSGSGGRPEDVRWADLLVAEHVANTVLSLNGIPATQTVLLHSEGRTFLESTRFDREGESGRKGLSSLEALDAAFYGRIETPWSHAAERLRSDGWISDGDADRLHLLWWFGKLIGNTDMHYGNISLYLTPERPLCLAPSYDMVPMQYRPGVEGQLSCDPLQISQPPPNELLFWTRAIPIAVHYWRTLSASQNVSKEFRVLAERNTVAVSEAAP
jgi:hypothetical protein